VNAVALAKANVALGVNDEDLCAGIGVNDLRSSSSLSSSLSPSGRGDGDQHVVKKVFEEEVKSMVLMLEELREGGVVVEPHGAGDLEVVGVSLMRNFSRKKTHGVTSLRAGLDKSDRAGLLRRIEDW
jgi:hypothetical protein